MLRIVTGLMEALLQYLKAILFIVASYNNIEPV